MIRAISRSVTTFEIFRFAFGTSAPSSTRLTSLPRRSRNTSSRAIVNTLEWKTTPPLLSRAFCSTECGTFASRGSANAEQRTWSSQLENSYSKATRLSRSIAPLHGDGQTETEVSRQVSCDLCSHRLWAPRSGLAGSLTARPRHSGHLLSLWASARSTRRCQGGARHVPGTLRSRLSS